MKLQIKTLSESTKNLENVLESKTKQLEKYLLDNTDLNTEVYSLRKTVLLKDSEI